MLCHPTPRRGRLHEGATVRLSPLGLEHSSHGPSQLVLKRQKHFDACIEGIKLLREGKGKKTR